MDITRIKAKDLFPQQLIFNYHYDLNSSCRKLLELIEVISPFTNSIIVEGLPSSLRDRLERRKGYNISSYCAKKIERGVVIKWRGFSRWIYLSNNPKLPYYFTAYCCETDYPPHFFNKDKYLENHVDWYDFVKVKV